jgi:DNA mismatch endonuclease, patch repair protein
MARVHSEDTSSELAVRKALHAAGYRFRLHVSKLPGKPDIVLPRYRTVVLVHGCLWHGHGCRRFRWPVANAAYWRQKIGRNIERDTANEGALRDEGWIVKVIWDCERATAIHDLLAVLRATHSQRVP